MSSVPEVTALDSMRIEVSRHSDRDEYVATSPDWSGASGAGWTIANAVAGLVIDVKGAMPLCGQTRAALRAEGGEEVVIAWDQLVRGRHTAEVRNGGLAAAYLRVFIAAGLSPANACAWIGAHVAAADALALEAVGMDAAAFDDYRRYFLFGSFDWLWEQPVGASLAEGWAIARVPMERARTYFGFNVFIVDAVALWEPLARNGMSLERLHAYLFLGMSASEAAEFEVAAAHGVDVVATLEMLVALKQPTPAEDPPF